MASKLLFILLIYHSLSYYAFAACNCSVSLVFSSPTKAAGTISSGYESDTTDPLGPWQGQSVCFEGTNKGDLTTFDYLITCTEACYIIDITVEGVAWFTTTLSIYNHDKSNLLGEIVRNDQNTFQTYTVTTTTETYLNQWRFTDTTPVCCYRYRSSITMTTKAITETFSPTAAPTSMTTSPTAAPVAPISLPVYSNQCDCTVSLIFASPRYPIGSTFGAYDSESTNPLAIWIGESVGFQGTDLGNVTTFDYQIDCNIPCWIKDLTINGIAWFTTTLSVYNGDKSILLGEINKNDQNTFQTYIINMSLNEQYLTQFRVVEMTYICCWRYRHSINITAIPKITTNSPTNNPSNNPSSSPLVIPTSNPSYNPATSNPSVNPSNYPTFNPFVNPSQLPTQHPTIFPTLTPSDNPSIFPTIYPTLYPSYNPSFSPTGKPTNDGEINDELITSEYSDSKENNQEQYAENNENNNLIYYIIAGIGAICLFCCIICVIYVLKYKNKKYNSKCIKTEENAPQTNTRGNTMAQHMEIGSMSSSHNFIPTGNASFNFVGNTNDMIMNDGIHQMNTPMSITNYGNDINVEEGAYTIPTNNNDNTNNNEIEMTNVATPNGYENNDLSNNVNVVEKINNNMMTPGYKNEIIPNLGDDEFVIEGDELDENEVIGTVNGVTKGFDEHEYIENCQYVAEDNDSDLDVLNVIDATPM